MTRDKVVGRWKFRQVVSEGGMIPKGWGIAKRDPYRALAITYPWGVHLIVRWFWLAYWKSVHLRPRAWFRALNKAYQDGYRDAMSGAPNRIGKMP